MSSSPPWMPLHVGDYLSDTGHLTVVEHGAYLLLIMRYWQDGGLPTDEKLIARYAHLTAEQWSESRDVLVALFDEGWKHKRIDAELAKASEIIGKRKEAGKQRQLGKSAASAEHVLSTSSYAGVPPSHEHIPDKTPPPVSVAEGARDLFCEVWSVFPRNPTSVETKAEAAFRATKAKDQVAILAAAQRYRRWFLEDCDKRGRTFDAGCSYVPHLVTWIESGAWKQADALPIKGDADNQVVVPMVRLDREKDRALWDACERISGKKAPTSGFEWSFRADVVEQARRAAS